LCLADGTFKVVPCLFFQLYSIHFELAPGLIPAAIYCLVYDRILDAIKAMIPTAASEQGIEKDLQMQRASFLQGIAGAQPSVPKRHKKLKARVQITAGSYLSSEI